MTRERIDLGKLGEELALEKIKRLGYKGIICNYRCPLGEVDIVARDGDCLVFVEIKARKRKSLGYAIEAVNARKKRQLSKVALCYMKANGCCEVKARFDVVAIHFGKEFTEVEVIKNAFELAY